MSEKKHPAPWAPAALKEIPTILRRWSVNDPTGATIVDPYAGCGDIHKLREFGLHTIAIEREPEWYAEALRRYPTRSTFLADSAEIDLVITPGSIRAVVTSPTWGNRMADRYLGGSDVVAGRKPPSESRRTYPTALGRIPTEGSTAVLQWGREYQALHRAHVELWVPLLEPGGIVIIDIGDHDRKRERQRVTDWWEELLEELIGPVEERRAVPAKRYTYGQNRGRWPETLLVAVAP